MVLKNLEDIKKPTDIFSLVKNDGDLEIKMQDYYRCLDTLDGVDDANQDDSDDESKNANGDGDSDEDDDGDEEVNPYSKEKQKELSYTQPLLIKGYGILSSGHSI